MKATCMCVTLIGVCLIFVCLTTSVTVATDAPSTQPAAAKPAATKPATTEPAATQPAERVLAMVGDIKIMSGPIDKKKRKKKNRPEVYRVWKQRYITEAIEVELQNAYIDGLSFDYEDLMEFIGAWVPPCPAKKNMKTVEQYAHWRGITVEKARRQVKERVIYEKLRREAVSPVKMAVYLKESPVSYFDGTQLIVSHILIVCKLYDPPEKRDAARKKLQGIAEEIKEGKISFTDAARKYSDCPSGARKGGRLRKFEFRDMAVEFSEVAFALEIGEMSDIVETEFGFHLIEVNDRIKGTGKKGDKSYKIAGDILVAKWNNKVLRQAIKDNPVKILE